MPHVSANEVNFLDGNNVGYDFAAACGIFANENNMFKKANWKPFKTLYFHAKGTWDIELKSNKHLKRTGIKINDHTFELVDLHVFDNGEEVESDEWRKVIEDVLSLEILDRPNLPDFDMIKNMAPQGMPDFDL